MNPHIENANLAALRNQLIAQLSWGDVSNWTQRDFIHLSQLIEEKTGEQLSVTTLKRLLGKVQYTGVPYVHTLDVVCAFMGYKSWLDFLKQHSKTNQYSAVHTEQQNKAQSPQILFFYIGAAVVISILTTAYLFFHFTNTAQVLTASDKATLISTNAYSDTLPHKVNFYYEIPEAYISNQNIITFGEREGISLVQIDENRSGEVSHTYTQSGFYRAKIFSNKMQLAEQDVLIESNGWKQFIEHSPKDKTIKVPIEGIQQNLSIESVQHLGIDTSANFNFIYHFFKKTDLNGDNCIVKTIVRSRPELHNNYLPKVMIKIMFSKQPIFITFDKSNSSKTIYNQVSEVVLPVELQKKHFCKDISDWSLVEVRTANNEAQIFLNKEKIYTIPYTEPLGQFVGIEYRFRGIGEVKSLELCNHANARIIHKTFPD